MKEHIDRLVRDIRHPWTRHEESRGRLGWKDIPHAVTNLPVEFCRVDPYTAGHWWMYTAIAALVAITAAVVF
jgi:hypothetical protein